MASQYRSVALITLLLLLGGCSTPGDKITAEPPIKIMAEPPIKIVTKLPIAPEIQPNVDFWRMVYGEWSRSQVAVHDDEHMGLIYEVVDLPGPIKGGYTGEQKRLVQAKKSKYSNRLASIERKLRSGAGMTRLERELYDRVVETAGRPALYGASDRVRLQRGVRERFRRGVEISGRYDEHFRKIFREQGVLEDLAYLPHVESSFQAHARSSVGAAGIWQFMPGTGRVYDLAVNRAVDERYDPILAAEGAARYLGDAYRKLGSWPLAITSYNHGQGGMAKAKSIYGDDIGRIVTRYKGRYFGFASRNFYAEFMAAREVAGNHRKYFPEGIAYEKPVDHDRLVLRHSMPAPHLASHYGLSVYRLENINPSWRKRTVQGRSSLRTGSTVWLPARSLTRVPSHPRPAPVRVAKAQSKSKSKRVVAKTKSKPRVASAKTHVVKPNDTLYRVAMRYDMSVKTLKRMNRMKSGDNTIRVGQRLRVSG